MDANAGGATKWFENHFISQEKYFLCKTDEDPVRRGKSKKLLSDIKLENEFVVLGVPCCRQEGTDRPHPWEVKVFC